MTLAGEFKEIMFLTAVILLGSYLVVVFAASPFDNSQEPSIVSCSPPQESINFYARDTVKITYSDGTIKRVTDYCARPNELEKHYCDPEGNLYQLRHECSGTCSNGQCINLCVDSNAEDATLRGIVTFNNRVYVDACTDASTVKEFSCSASNDVITEVRECPQGTACNDGRCQ